MIGQSYPDFITPTFATAALIAALDYKRRTGKGQYIDQSNFEPSLHWIAPAILDYSANKHVVTRSGNKVPYAAPHNAYPCKGDDRWCVIAVMSETEWENLCKVMGKPKLASDPMFSTLLDRKSNETKLDSVIGNWTINFTADEVMERLQGVGVPAGKVQTIKDVIEDRQLRHRGFFHDFQHPEIGTYETGNTTYILSRTPSELRLAAPCLGEHTEYVCRQLLDMPEEEFIGLLTENVFE
jgi:benzylsuccinate CoA-transferase BbsF subunit